jgi:glycerol uptake facilitator-like aquaporin
VPFVEFVGTFLLTLVYGMVLVALGRAHQNAFIAPETITGTLNVTSDLLPVTLTTSGETIYGLNYHSILTPTIAIGVLLGLLVFAGDYVQHGHYNPTATAAIAVARYLSTPVGQAIDIGQQFLTAAMAIVAQCLGGLAGAAMALWLAGGTLWLYPRWEDTTGNDIARVLFAESIFEALLVGAYLVFLHSDGKQSVAYGAVVGLAFIVGRLATANISGGWLNPAVALGLLAVNDIWHSNSTAPVTGWWAYTLVVPAMALVFAVAVWLAFRMIFQAQTIFSARMAAPRMRSSFRPVV